MAQVVVPVVAPRTLLLVGPCETSQQTARLRREAVLVAAELGVSVTVMTDMHVDVSGFDALYIAEGFLSSVPTAVVWSEAGTAGVPVMERQDRRLNAVCVCSEPQHVKTVRYESGEVWRASCAGTHMECAWCLDVDPFEEDTFVVESGNTFAPMCAGCLDGARRSGYKVRVHRRAQ